MVDNTAKQPAILSILKLVNTNMVIKTFDHQRFLNFYSLSWDMWR
jgi:hypothetical protein